MNHFLRHANTDNDVKKAYDKYVSQGYSAEQAVQMAANEANQKNRSTKGLEDVNAGVQRLTNLGFSGDEALQMVLQNDKVMNSLGGEQKVTANRKQGQNQAAIKEANINRGFNSAEEAQAQYAQANRPYFGPKSASEAQGQYAATSAVDAKKNKVSSDNRNASEMAKQAQSQASAISTRSAAEAAAKSGNSDASAAYGAAARQSSADAAKMDWNNSGDQRFAEWKKNYNRMYYQQHKQEWQPGGKYYQKLLLSKSLSDVNKSPMFYQDSATGERKLVNGVYRDPETNRLVDLRGADEQTRKAYEEWIKIQQRVNQGGPASNSSDRDMRRLYEEYAKAGRGAAEAAAGRAGSYHRGSKARDMLTRNTNNNVAAGPSFMNELRTSAGNFARGTRNAAKKVKEVSANAVSKGKKFISGIRGMLGI